MIKTSSKMLFISITIFSSILVMSSPNWFGMWMGMEINMMAFIPLMFNSKNNFLSQSAMMYFLAQSLASIIFISFLLQKNFLTSNLWEKETMYIIMLSMMMKMGMPPFHMWYPEIMNKMSWNMCLMLSTWQKVAPIHICSQTMNYSNTSMMMIMLSTVSGAIMGLNQTSTRKIMAYSSMNHLGWMMACALSNKKSWMIYMSLYMILMTTVCMMMYEYNILYINQYNLKSLTFTEKMMMLSMMLSLGGMPPFLGFMPKWIAIENMIQSNEITLLLVMMWTSMLTMSYYIRMTSSMNLMKSHSQKWNNLIKTKKMNMSMMFTINMTLPLSIMTMNFL